MRSNYYQENAQKYCAETTAMTMAPVLERFAVYLDPGCHVLDVGCGSGRDSRWFLENSFEVTAFDACPELAALASDYIGQEVIVGDYHDIVFANEFDAIWACASLLHCPKSNMLDVLIRLVAALKQGGFFYISFKDGDGGGVDHLGRFFNYYTLKSLTKLLAQVPGVIIVDSWENSIELRGGNQGWVNVVVQKRG